MSVAPVPGPPSPAYAAPPVLDPFPRPGTEYHHFFRTPRYRWWRGALAIVLLVLGFLVLSTVLSAAAVAVDLGTGRIALDEVLAGRLTITPVLLLSVNLTAAAMIPYAMLLQRLFFGLPPGWLSSVRGRFRWSLMARSALVVLPIWVLYVGLAVVADPGAPGGPFTAESVALLLVVLVTTPLQAAGEEYGVRGLVARAAASWVADRRIALVLGTAVSAALFAVAHGSTDPWFLAFYFSFGVAMGLVVWRTGGLEVSALIHTANNLLLFVVTIIAGSDLTEALDPRGRVGGPFVLLPIVVIALTTGVVWWWAGRNRIERTFAHPALGR